MIIESVWIHVKKMLPFRQIEVNYRKLLAFVCDADTRIWNVDLGKFIESV